MTARISRAVLNLAVNQGRTKALSRTACSLQPYIPSCFLPIRMPTNHRSFSVGTTAPPSAKSAIDPVANTGTAENHSDNPSSPVKPADAQPISEPNETKPNSNNQSSQQTSSTGPLPFEQMRIRPQLLAAFTCTHCETRSTRRISRQAYSEGVVLARCGGCKQLHLLADHLGWFSDRRETIEDIMRDKGVNVQRVSLPQEGSETSNGDMNSQSEARDDSVHYLPEAHLRWRDHDDVLEVMPDDVVTDATGPAQT